MRNYLLKTRRNSPQKSNIVFILQYTLGMVVLLCVLFFAKSSLARTGQLFFLPFYHIQQYFNSSTATIPVFIRSRDDLLQNINELKQEIDAQAGIKDTLALVTAENNELRTLLHASSTPRTIAGIIATPPYTPYDTIILDRGSEEGVVVHAPVFYGSGKVLGYVQATLPHTALVTLFSSPNLETTVYVYGPNIFATAYGEGGGVTRISVPQGVKLEKGNTVILPSIDSGALGTITDIQSIPTEPEQHGYITFDTPLQSIRLVSIGKQPLYPSTFDQAQIHVTEEEKRLFTFDVPEAFKTTSTSTATSTATQESAPTTPVATTTTETQISH